MNQDHRPRDQKIVELQQQNEALNRVLEDSRHELARCREQLAYAQAMLEAAEAQEHLLRALIDASPSIIFALDPQGRHIMVNQRFAEVLNRTSDAVIGSTAFDLFPPTIAETLHAHTQHILTSGRHDEREVQIQLPDGIYTFFESKFPIHDAKGRLIAIGGMSTDITDRKQIEEQLRTFQTLVENAPDGITIVALDGHLRYANPAFKQFLGYGEATIGMHMTEFRPNAQQSELQQVMQQIHAQGVWRGRQVYQKQNGESFAAHVAAFLIYNEQAQPYALMGIHRDMTEQDQQEYERTALQQQLIDAQQNAIRQLSSPLLPLTDSVIALPLIGAIDSRRAQQVMETLLEGVVQYQAEVALIDITGIEVVDTQVAQALMRAAQAVRLLGAQVILTGIQPQIAQTLVHLGVDLREITAFGSLQAGIAAVLHTDY
jgi:PAS domain S-box-containing protein